MTRCLFGDCSVRITINAQDYNVGLSATDDTAEKVAAKVTAKLTAPGVIGYTVVDNGESTLTLTAASNGDKVDLAVSAD